MTQTIQPRSWAKLNEPGKDLTIQDPETPLRNLRLNEPYKDLPIQKPITEETIRDLRSLKDDLNELQKGLEGLFKVINVLCDERTDFLQAIYKATQIVNLIQNTNKGEKR
jgi:hypothetical protein